MRWPGSGGCGGGSAGEMRARKPAEPTNETASTSSATGAVTAWVRMPPRLGPAMNETARLPYTSEFASR